MNKFEEKLEMKVKDCFNTNSIFNTKKYVLLSDAKKILNQSLEESKSHNDIDKRDNYTDKIEYHRLKLGIKKYGYDSEFMKSYESMVAQLRHNELNDFFDKWEIPHN